MRGTAYKLLRQQEALLRACAQVGLALVVALAVSSPAALAASEKPKPQPLWEAFPLNPTGQRLDSAKQPVLKPPVQGRPEATKVEETPAPTSRPGAIALALFAGVALLALGLVGFVSMRRLFVRSHHSGPPVSTWQGISWSNPADTTRQLPEPGAERAVAVGAEHPAAGLHPDVPAAAYRLQRLERPRRRRSRVTGHGRRAPSYRMLVDGLAGVARRVKAVVWTEQIAPVIVGAALAGVTGFLIVHWVG